MLPAAVERSRVNPGVRVSTDTQAGTLYQGLSAVWQVARRRSWWKIIATARWLAQVWGMDAFFRNELLYSHCEQQTDAPMYRQFCLNHRNAVVEGLVKKWVRAWFQKAPDTCSNTDT